MWCRLKESYGRLAHRAERRRVDTCGEVAATVGRNPTDHPADGRAPTFQRSDDFASVESIEDFVLKKFSEGGVLLKNVQWGTVGGVG